MKISVMNYSFNRCKEPLSVFGIMDTVKSFGADGIDFIEKLKKEGTFTPELALEVKAYAEKLGLEIICYHIEGSDLIKKPDLDAEVKRICDQIDIANILGCKLVRTDITYGFPPEVKTRRGVDNAIELALPYLKRIVAYAEKIGITVTTENHGRFFQDPDRIEKLINVVGSDYFAVLLDMSNFTGCDYDPAVSFGKLAQYCRHVHAKDSIIRDGMLDDPGEGWGRTRGQHYSRCTIVGHGSVPVKPCLRILKAAGYDGYVSVEFEGIEDPILAVRISVDNLRRYLSEI